MAETRLHVEQTGADTAPAQGHTALAETADAAREALVERIGREARRLPWSRPRAGLAQQR